MVKSKMQQLLDDTRNINNTDNKEDLGTNGVENPQDKNPSVNEDENPSDDSQIVNPDGSEEMVGEASGDGVSKNTFEGSKLQKILLQRRPNGATLKEELARRKGNRTPISVLEQLKDRKR